MCPITVTHPMELVHVDVVGIETNPNATRSTVAKVLVVTDHFTRFTQAYLIPNEQAKTIANALWSGFLSVFGAPARLISDQGPSFESKLIAELCALLGVEKVRTTPYHPQGNGQVERANQTLLTMLRKLSTEDKREWYKQLPTLTHAYNCTRSAVTGYSPYFLMFGKRPRTSVDLFFPTAREEPSERNYKRYVTRLRLGLQDAFASAEAAIAKESARQKRYYDTKIRGVVLEKGDIVQLATSAIHQRRKLMDRWSEILYKVTSVSQDIPVLEIQPVGGGKPFRVHRNRLRLLRQGTNCVAARSTHVAEASRNSLVGERLPVKEGTELRDEGASPPVASAVMETSPGEVSSEGNWGHLPMEAKMREQNSDELSAETHPLGKTQFGQASHKTFTDPGQIVIDDGS
jgi:transposase InsO family protein